MTVTTAPNRHRTVDGAGTADRSAPRLDCWTRDPAGRCFGRSCSVRWLSSPQSG